MFLPLCSLPLRSSHLGPRLSLQPPRPNPRVPRFFAQVPSASPFSLLSLCPNPAVLRRGASRTPAPALSSVLCLDPSPAFLGPLRPCCLPLNPGALRQAPSGQLPPLGPQPTRRPSSRVPPRTRLPSLHAQAPQAPPLATEAPPPRFAQAPPLTHLRQLRARAGWGGEGEGTVLGRGGRGGGGPPLWPGRPSAGGVESLRRRQPGRSRGPGVQRRRLHLHQRLHLRRDRPPPHNPPITAVPPPPNNFRSYYQATGAAAEHRAPASRETAGERREKR